MKPRIQSIQQRYEILVVDIEGNPINDAKVNYELSTRGFVVDNSSCSLDNDGKCLLSIDAKLRSLETYFESYESKLKLRVIKKGYYSKLEVGEQYQTDSNISNPKQVKIVLTCPEDYLDSSSSEIVSDQKLKENIFNFIDKVVLSDIISGVVLDYHSIKISSFKGKKYLCFSFVNMVEYNSLKLDKYGIAREIFDDVIRGMLSNFNNYIDDTSRFSGFDITILAESRNFLENKSMGKVQEFRFLFTRETVDKYKNRDITSQQAVDQAIVLIDSDRDELRLQP